MVLPGTIRSAYGYVRIDLMQYDGDPPRNVAVSALVATSRAGYLQEGVGLIDDLYVVSDRPEGLQLVRGPVYSYYSGSTPAGRR
ncbi:MAG: DUF3160 domain-containing protein [Chloroflexi bacterium]|nr:DUF3160 domain-containing protein [Chloroflexota bacterium]